MSKSISVLLLSAAISLLIGTPRAFALKCDETTPKFTRWDLVETLRRGGFPNVMLNEYVELNRVGNIKVNEATCFTLYIYDVLFNRGTRETKRLLVIKNESYIGMYPIDNLADPIGLFGNELVFPDTFGIENKVVFDREEPAEEIYLGGAMQILMKPKSPDRLKSPVTGQPQVDSPQRTR